MSFFSKVRIDDRRYAEAAGLFVKNIRWNDVTIEGLQTMYKLHIDNVGYDDLRHTLIQSHGKI